MCAGGRVAPGSAGGQGRLTGWLWELSAMLAVGLVVLTVVLFGAWGLAAADGDPGPGAAMLAGHLVGALAAVAGYRVSRPRTDLLGWAARCVPVLVVLLLGVSFWWS